MITAEELSRFPDTFNGDDAHLVRCIEALLSLDATGTLVPHGIGGHARGLLSAAMHRLVIQSRAAGVQGVMSAWVGDMKTSAGMDYYVCVGHGKAFDEYLTPNIYKIRGRAECDVACWNHLFGNCDKPDILAFDTGDPTAATQPPNTIRVDVEQIGSCELDVRDGVAYMSAVTVQDIVSKSFLKAQPPKDAGAVPMPEVAFRRHENGEVFSFYDSAGLIRYGNAREAAGRADAVPDSVTRTDHEIVQQTEELAALFMLEIYSREAVGGDSVFRDADDLRGKHCWQLACRVQEMLTATDPENAVSGIDDSRAAHPSPAHAGAGDAEALAKEVWTALDKESCPGVYMQIAYETVFRRLAGGDHA